MPDSRVPAPLAELGDLVEVEVRPAPGGKGSELRARLRSPNPPGRRQRPPGCPGTTRVSGSASALREAKQLIEVGEVLRVDPRPTADGHATPTGAVVEPATKRAAGEGVL